LNFLVITGELSAYFHYHFHTVHAPCLGIYEAKIPIAASTVPARKTTFDGPSEEESPRRHHKHLH